MSESCFFPGLFRYPGLPEVGEQCSTGVKLYQLLLLIFFSVSFTIWLSLLLTGLSVSNWSQPPWRQIKLCDLGESLLGGRKCCLMGRWFCVPGQSSTPVSLVGWTSCFPDFWEPSERQAGFVVYDQDLIRLQMEIQTRMNIRTRQTRLDSMSAGIRGGPSWCRYCSRCLIFNAGYSRPPESESACTV